MGLLDLFGHKYPFTDFHELNLDWCITAVLQLQKAFEDFSAGNKIVFADPLQHDLTKTYAKNTIVVDPVSGTAYLSLDTVPKGVQLDNTDYWLPVFDFAGYVTRANQNFTDNYFSGTDRSPIPLVVGDWVVLDDVLYKVTVAIAADDLFIIGTNIVHFTVEQFLNDFITSVNNTLAAYSLTIQQYKDDIDASELAYRQQLARDIANTTDLLQSQLNLAISGVTVDSEVIDARLGYNGVTYPTLGDAIRTQVSDLTDEVNKGLEASRAAIVSNGIRPYLLQGSIYRITPDADYLKWEYNHPSWVCTDVRSPLLLYKGDSITCDSPFIIRTIFKVIVDKTGTLMLWNNRLDSANYEITETGYYLIVFAQNPAANTVPSDLEGKVTITCTGIVGTVDSIDKKRHGNYLSLLTQLYKGQYEPNIVQGSLVRSADNKYMVNDFTSSTYCAIDAGEPLFLRGGDIIDVNDSDFILKGVINIDIDDNGDFINWTVADPTTPYTIPQDGLYLFSFRRSNASDIVPEDLDDKVIIYPKTYTPVLDFERKRDPYSGLYWGSEQILTTCHCHCTSDLQLSNMITAGYDALIPTNYRPNRPWYPLKDFYNVSGVNDYLSAPNQEVSGFHFGSVGRYSHVCPVGSYMSSGDNNGSAVYKGNFNDFMLEARKTRKSFKQGGVVINHPYYSGDTAAEILKLLRTYPDILGLEIYNFTCEVLEGNGYAVNYLDYMLSRGVQCFAFACPDHQLQSATIPDFNAAFGFLHVIMSCNTEEAMLSAISNGEFYCTLYKDSLRINEIKLSGGTYSIDASCDNPLSIKIKTALQEVTTSGDSATLSVTSDDIYVRAEVSDGTNTAYTNAIMI